jgi:hypothetical protein
MPVIFAYSFPSSQYCPHLRQLHPYSILLHLAMRLSQQLHGFNPFHWMSALSTLQVAVTVYDYYLFHLPLSSP